METKTCSKCGRELPVTEFNKHNRTPDGLQKWCRECQKEHWHEKHVGVPVKRRSPLSRYTDAELLNELKARAKNIMLNPTPRDMMQALANLGYKGKLEYTQVHVIDINNF